MNTETENRLPRQKDEGGLTILELLVTMLIISVLAGTSFQSYQVYRSQAYQASRRQLMKQLETAFEIGLSDYESSGVAINDGTINIGGGSNFVSNGGRRLLPGFTTPDGTMFLAAVYGTCQRGNPTCVSHAWSIETCSENRRDTQVVYGDGRVVYTPNMNGWNFPC